MGDYKVLLTLNKSMRTSVINLKKNIDNIEKGQKRVTELPR